MYAPVLNVGCPDDGKASSPGCSAVCADPCPAEDKYNGGVCPSASPFWECRSPVHGYYYTRSLPERNPPTAAAKPCEAHLHQRTDEDTYNPSSWALLSHHGLPCSLPSTRPRTAKQHTKPCQHQTRVLQAVFEPGTNEDVSWARSNETQPINLGDCSYTGDHAVDREGTGRLEGRPMGLRHLVRGDGLKAEFIRSETHGRDVEDHIHDSGYLRLTGLGRCQTSMSSRPHAVSQPCHDYPPLCNKLLAQSPSNDPHSPSSPTHYTAPSSP